MEIYQVGGAVRDKLLGLQVADRDWVVVGAAPEQLEQLGYRRVGRDFPVFLHPETHEEYALARTERKTGHGYKGFAVHAAPDVTLEDDLRRRDITINAMAMAADGTIIDPFGGQQDLQRKLLRHVSSAFTEDPLRVLRVARFAARFAGLGFTVADDTIGLMRQIVNAGEMEALVPDRVWIEVERALGEERPSIFFEVLRGCGALARLFPEIDDLFGVPQRRDYHPEIDAGKHVMAVLDQAARLSDSTRVRFAALMHDLGKGVTSPDVWPQHIGHEGSSVELVKAVCARFPVPREHQDLALLAARYHTHCHRVAELRPATLLETLYELDAFRRPDRFGQFLLVCMADARGRAGNGDAPYPQRERMWSAFEAARAVDAREVVAAGLAGAEVAAELKRRRVAAISSLP